MPSVSLKDARKNLGHLIDAAAHGEAVTIMRRGKPAARLVPAEKRKHGSFPDLTEFRASLQVKGKALSKTIRELRDRERA